MDRTEDLPLADAPGVETSDRDHGGRGSTEHQISSSKSLGRRPAWAANQGPKSSGAASTASAALTSSESLSKPVLVRAALISPGSTRALSRSVRKPFSLPLAANVESANSTRADVIGSIDLARADEGRCVLRRTFFALFADVIAALPCRTLFYNMSDNVASPVSVPLAKTRKRASVCRDGCSTLAQSSTATTKPTLA